MATNQEELLDTIGNMTVLELSEFVDAFKDKFNVTAAAPVVVAGGAAAAGAEVAEEKDEFDVVLEGIGDKKIQVSRWSERSRAWVSKRPRTWSIVLRARSGRPSARTRPSRSRPN